jgi:hypothetical protein
VPTGPAGSPLQGGSGGGSDHLPGLNLSMPPCPIGMSQEDCNARSVPVVNYLLSNSLFSGLTSPVDAPEEPVIQNGIDVEDAFNFGPLVSTPRPIAHTRSRGNTEDLRFGTSGDVSGITPSLVPLPDEALFDKMNRLFAACTVFDNDLNGVGNRMINKFRSRNGDPFEDGTLTQKVSQSATLINFAKKFGDELRTRLAAANGNIDLVTNFETNGYRPIFNGLYNKFHGLQILVNDTEFTEIQLDDFHIDNSGNWNAIITITIHDHFGLDKQDALSFQDYHGGFASWWLLQHTRGYTPFETVIKVQKRIKGKI